MFLVVALGALMVVVGCASAQERAVDVVDTQLDDEAAEVIESSAQGGDQMPECDFGIDEQAYLAEAYALDNADGLDLIGYDQLAWIGTHSGTTVVVVAEPDDEASAPAVAAAQAAGLEQERTVYVFEPMRDADGASMDEVAANLVTDGFTNLDGLESGSVIILDSKIVGGDGEPAPVTAVANTPDDISTTIEDAYHMVACAAC